MEKVIPKKKMETKVNIEEILDRWTNINEILLRTGELSAQEKRTVLAVTNAMAREIRKELDKTKLVKAQCTLEELDALIDSLKEKK